MKKSSHHKNGLPFVMIMVMTFIKGPSADLLTPHRSIAYIFFPRISNQEALLKWTHLSAVRTLPMRPAAGHSPQIFFHAGITDLKSAGTGPAKGLPEATAAALVGRFSFFSSFVSSRYLHGLSDQVSSLIGRYAKPCRRLQRLKLQQGDRPVLVTQHNFRAWVSAGF